MGDRRDKRREQRRANGISGIVKNAQLALAAGRSVIGKGDRFLTILLSLFDADELQEAFNAMEDAAPKLLRLLNFFDALIGDIDPEKILEFRVAVGEKIAELDANGDGKITAADIVPFLWQLIF